GVLQAVAAEDEHRQLGQVVAGQHVELAAVEHFLPGARPVAVEAGRVADAQRHFRAAFGSRLGPAGAAHAWATVSHAFASSPVACNARSAAARRWVTSRQKSRIGPTT